MGGEINKSHLKCKDHAMTKVATDSTFHVRSTKARVQKNVDISLAALNCVSLLHIFHFSFDALDALDALDAKPL